MNYRPIAIYLPQFHPIKENDEWWGKGFTEWTNVAKATPLFKGHYQPHLPADLGFYDLRVPEVREEQAEIAKAYGIYGFCYYHYWFNGRRVLERPFQEVFESGKPDFPFMLCWANENWTRRWDGEEDDILLKQDYNDKDDEAHIEYLINYFKDPRYIRVNNKPVIIIYKSFLLPNPKVTTDIWRRVAAQHGLELYICHMAFSYRERCEMEDGFDAVIDFEPFGIRRSNVFSQISKNREAASVRSNLLKRALKKLNFIKDDKDIYIKYNVVDYDFYFENLKSLRDFNFKVFPCIVPGWDNTARRNTSPTLVLKDSTPVKFKQWLQKIIDDFVPYSKEEDFLFINAWNEWAEGNHLEPCKKWGDSYLQVIKDLLKQKL